MKTSYKTTIITIHTCALFASVGCNRQHDPPKVTQPTHPPATVAHQLTEPTQSNHFNKLTVKTTTTGVASLSAITAAMQTVNMGLSSNSQLKERDPNLIAMVEKQKIKMERLLAIYIAFSNNVEAIPNDRDKCSVVSCFISDMAIQKRVFEELLDSNDISAVTRSAIELRFIFERMKQTDGIIPTYDHAERSILKGGTLEDALPRLSRDDYNGLFALYWDIASIARNYKWDDRSLDAYEHLAILTEQGSPVECATVNLELVKLYMAKNDKTKATASIAKYQKCIELSKDSTSQRVKDLEADAASLRSRYGLPPVASQ